MEILDLILETENHQILQPVESSVYVLYASNLSAMQLRLFGRTRRLFCSSVSGLEEEVAAGFSSEVGIQKRRWPLDPYGIEIRTAKARRLGISTSTHKLNLVARLVRGMPVNEAYRQLAGSKKYHSAHVSRTIEAAVTNAKYFGLNVDRLIVQRAFVGKGRYIKSIRPHSKGRFGIEHKKYAHLTVILQELDEEQWECKVAPQYVHLQYRKELSNRTYNIEGWTVESDLDNAFFNTRETVKGLKVALGRPWITQSDFKAVKLRTDAKEDDVPVKNVDAEADATQASVDVDKQNA